MKCQFSKETIQVLHNAGWARNHQVDADEITNVIRVKEFPVLGPVVEFLKKYGGLTMKFMDKKSGVLQDLNFEFAEAMDIVLVEGLERYLPRIGCEKLCTIGTAFNDYLIIMMDENGRVYGCYEDYLGKLGDSGEMCIENIVMNTNIQEIE